MASGSMDMTVRLWDAAAGEERRKLEGHDWHVTAVALSSNGKTVGVRVLGQDGRTVRFSDRQGEAETRKVQRCGYRGDILKGR
jgi:WD40 repeat protein